MEARYKCRGCSLLFTKLKQCGACQQYLYCSFECQKNEWPRHKKETCVASNQEIYKLEIDNGVVRKIYDNVPGYTEPDDTLFLNIALNYTKPAEMKRHATLEFYDIDAEGVASVHAPENVNLQAMLMFIKKYICYKSTDESWKQEMSTYHTRGIVITACSFRWENAALAFCLLKSKDKVSLWRNCIRRVNDVK